MYPKASGSVAGTLLPGFTTVTSTIAAVCAGVVHVIDVLLTTTTFTHAMSSSETVAPAWKFVPVMVTDVPPVVGPLLGVMAVTARAAV